MPTQMKSPRVVRTALLALLACSSVVGSARAATIKVMTYNTHHGGTAASPPSTDRQLDMIAAQKPDVVVLQEAETSQLTYYVNGLNARLGTTAWHGAYARHCGSGSQPTCSAYKTETVMILTRLKTLATSSTLIWAKDDYHVARSAIRMSVALSDGRAVNVFSTHLPALVAYRTARLTYVSSFQAWARSFSGPRFVGGDFNDTPGQSPIVAMEQQYVDAWANGGSGSGYTHASGGATTTTRRIDYWFSSIGGPQTLTSVKVVGSLSNSDHLGVVATYSMPPLTSTPSPAPSPVPPTAETTVLDDRFDTFDPNKWPYGVLTGTQDSTIPLGVTGGALRIGPLKQSMSGSHYNGLSSRPYNLTSNGYAFVRLIKSPSNSTTAYAIFSVASDASNFYRWYVSGNSLVAERKIAGTKKVLANLQYSASSHQFLRIRLQYNTATGSREVVFETAPNNAGVPGTYTQRYRESWDAHVVATALRFELKAGTSVAELSPGYAYWDNFRAVRR
jgi:endonuclease/exonuclease/phosphatase family metal-dependent hydrolase